MPRKVVQRSRFWTMVLRLAPTLGSVRRLSLGQSPILTLGLRHTLSAPLVFRRLHHRTGSIGTSSVLGASDSNFALQLNSQALQPSTLAWLALHPSLHLENVSSQAGSLLFHSLLVVFGLHASRHGF